MQNIMGENGICFENIKLKNCLIKVILDDEVKEFWELIFDSNFNWKTYGKKNNEIYLDNEKYIICKNDYLIYSIIFILQEKYSISKWEIYQNLNEIFETKFYYLNKKNDVYVEYEIAFLPKTDMYYTSVTEIRIDYLGEKIKKHRKSILNINEFKLFIKELNSFVSKYEEK